MEGSHTNKRKRLNFCQGTVRTAKQVDYPISKLLQMSPTKLRAALVFANWGKSHYLESFSKNIDDDWESAGVRACFNVPLDMLINEDIFIECVGDKCAWLVGLPSFTSWCKQNSWTGPIEEEEESVDWDALDTAYWVKCNEESQILETLPIEPLFFPECDLSPINEPCLSILQDKESMKLEPGQVYSFSRGQISGQAAGCK